MTRIISNIGNVNPGIFRSIIWNCDGEYCITCDSFRIVSLWNPYPSAEQVQEASQIKPLAQYKGHNRDVLSVHASSDNAKICSAGQDKAVFCWDVESGRITHRLTHHTGRIQCARFTHTDANGIISGSLDCHVCVWDLRRSSKPVQIMKDAKDAIYSLVTTDAQHQHRIITGSLDCRVRTYDLRKTTLFTDCVGWPVSCVRTDGNQAVLVCCQDGPLRLLDLSDGQILADYKGHSCKSFIVECDLDCSGSKVMAGSETDGIVRVWDMLGQNEIDQLKHSTNSPILTLATHPTKSGRLITAQNSRFYVWQQDT
ncbi:hypothetical protein GJ496_000554 [Pomphorhynchus laevis]|nr:hypothetical protein GJ496_000554 [Pomphorhynchus laevis]